MQKIHMKFQALVSLTNKITKQKLPEDNASCQKGVIQYENNLNIKDEMQNLNFNIAVNE